MLLDRDYRKPFWHGFFHAVLVALYSLFLAVVLITLQRLFVGDVGVIIQTTFFVFLGILSLGVCGYLIFFEAVKKAMNHHFRAATMMMVSTLGWLLIFLVIFLIGLVATVPSLR